MILNISNPGKHGIITDLHAFQMEPEAQSSGKNVRFRNGKAIKFLGDETFKAITANWDGGNKSQIYYLMPVADGSNYYWIACGLNDVVVYDKTTDTVKEITNAGGDYTATASTVNWTGGIIGGVPVLNNGVNLPQMWDKDFSTPGKLAALTGFSSAADSCIALRVYKNYLVALNVVKSSTRYPTLVKWSDSAALGAVPTSWDETDATTDAGETDLAETRGNVSRGICLDCLPLRDSNIIYCDDSVWSMDFIGGQFVFRFKQIFPSWGMLTYKCMEEFEGKHFVVSNGDVYVHDGVTAQSVIDGKRRKELFSKIDGTDYWKTYVYANRPRNEMWICFVEDSAACSLPTKAFVWNWRENTWGERDLANTTTYGTAHIASGILDVSVSTDLWSAETASTWVDWDVPWGELGYAPQGQAPAMATNIILKADSTNQFNGSDMTSYMERKDIPLAGEGNFCRVNRVYIRATGGPFDVFVGVQQRAGGTVDYSNSVSFTPGTTRKIDVRKTGTHLALKIQSDQDVEWEVSGIDVEYEPIFGR